MLIMLDVTLTRTSNGHVDQNVKPNLVVRNDDSLETAKMKVKNN